MCCCLYRFSPLPPTAPLQLLRALASTALADAQQLTLLRAIAKGNQPPLIAAIAADTAELYALAGSQVRRWHGSRGWEAGEGGRVRCWAAWLRPRLDRPAWLSGCGAAPSDVLQAGTAAVPGAAGGKLFHYSKYKQVFARVLCGGRFLPLPSHGGSRPFAGWLGCKSLPLPACPWPLPPQAYARAHAHIFNGITLWKADKCGAGLKCLEAAAAELKAAKAAAGAFDAAPVASLNLHHRCGGSGQPS